MDREKFFSKLYRLCFRYPNIKEDFCKDWFYIHQMLFDGEEEKIPDVILEMINTWLDSH